MKSCLLYEYFTSDDLFYFSGYKHLDMVIFAIPFILLFLIAIRRVVYNKKNAAIIVYCTIWSAVVSPLMYLDYIYKPELTRENIFNAIQVNRIIELEGKVTKANKSNVGYNFSINNVDFRITDSKHYPGLSTYHLSLLTLKSLKSVKIVFVDNVIPWVDNEKIILKLESLENCTDLKSKIEP